MQRNPSGDKHWQPGHVGWPGKERGEDFGGSFHGAHLFPTTKLQSHPQCVEMIELFVILFCEQRERKKNLESAKKATGLIMAKVHFLVYFSQLPLTLMCINNWVMSVD